MTRKNAATVREARAAVQPRMYWLDMLRTSAVFAVVALHVSAYVVTGVRDTSSMHWWFGNIVDSACRWSVPVFVMVSGALLLNPRDNEGYGTVIKKRLARLAAPIVFWTAGYLLFISVYGRLNLGSVYAGIITGKPYYHLWYIYMLPGLYLATPLLRTYIKGSTDLERLFFCTFVLVSASLHTAASHYLYGKVMPQTVFTMFIPYLGYYVLGYQLSRPNAPCLPAVPAAALVVGCLAVTFLGMGVMANRYGLDKGLFFYNEFSPFHIVSSIGIFMLFSRKGSGIPYNKTIAGMSRCTLGIYLLHPMFIDFLRVKFHVTPTSFHSLLSIPVFSLGTFLASYVMVYVMLQIYYLRKTVGG